MPSLWPARRIAANPPTTTTTPASGVSKTDEVQYSYALIRRRLPKMSGVTSSEAAKAVVRRNTEEVQCRGNFDLFEELFADYFVDHTPQPGTTPDKAGVRK